MDDGSWDRPRAPDRPADEAADTTETVHLPRRPPALPRPASGPRDAEPPRQWTRRADGERRPGPRPPVTGGHLPPYVPPLAPGPDDQRTTALPRSPGRGAHLPPYREPLRPPAGPTGPPPDTSRTGTRNGRGPDEASTPFPKKVTVTRVAAWRSRELTNRGVQMFRRAATADGADRSGLTNLTYAVMGNYAVDAALAVALANTLFFAAATAESTGKVLLYLLITVAPFAVIAPFIGPALDRLQHGRRVALAASSFARAVLALIMVFQFDTWALYPCALGMLVLSKSFGVLKAALTPRVLPEQSTLTKTNSRLTVFGLMAGGVCGALAAGLSAVFGSGGALWFTAALAVGGGLLCLRIPAWVESTAGEVPVEAVVTGKGATFPVQVTTTLWANGTIRVETGFLALFIAFVVKSEYPTAGGFTQLLLLGVVGAAAGLGGFLGNALGARIPLRTPDLTALLALGAVTLTTLVAVLAPGLATAAVVGLVGSTASSLAKVCLDSSLQHHLPEASRASAFGRSETVLQLSWVFGGVVGLLIGGVWSFGHDEVYSVGFGVVTAFLAVGLLQTWLVRSGRTIVPAGVRLPRPRFGRRHPRTDLAPADPTAPTTRTAPPTVPHETPPSTTRGPIPGRPRRRSARTPKDRP
ncbi:MFS transporter [Nakamurella flavida]|uniref:MFS transporter n=1 Tax=Nakamurella flavida TaxID=363630 RepID=UPI001966B00E|nr:MFS transporter [Nakamurella flavida]